MGKVFRYGCNVYYLPYLPSKRIDLAPDWCKRYPHAKHLGKSEQDRWFLSGPMLLDDALAGRTSNKFKKQQFLEVWL